MPVSALIADFAETLVREELAYIKAHIVDAHTILTFDEETLIEEALSEYEAGKETKLEGAFERELN